nr:hypothetical protein [uncultured Rhodopila sp.]
MLRRRIFPARIRRLPAVAVLAAALAGSGAAAAAAAAAAGATYGPSRPGGTAIRVAQADTGRILAEPIPGADPIIGSTDVLGPPETLTLAHPSVLTTGRLRADVTSVTLSGIDGEAGDAAQALREYIAAAGDRVDCRPQGDGRHVCLTPDGTDIAEVALANGAARARPEAPDAYREQEIAAQTARRGVWAALPLPPDTVRHPIVRDTATLASATTTYPLFGIIGLGEPYAGQLQAYIAARGDSMACSLQGGTGGYICLLPDGTDIAQAALVNGVARAGSGAPADYRAQQLDALNNRRGYWLTATDAVITEALTPPVQPGPVVAAGEDGTDGISYAGGAPVAVIDGAPVLLAFAAGLGWGYYDHVRHWHTAPDRYRVHLDYIHPAGKGLPGYADRRDEMRHEASIRPGAAWHEPVVHPGIPAATDRPRMYGHPPEPHTGIVEPLPHPEPMGHPDRLGWSDPHPAVRPPGGMAMAAPRFAPPPGGGFSHSGPQSGPHPAAPAQPMRAAGPPSQAGTSSVRRQ